MAVSEAPDVGVTVGVAVGVTIFSLALVSGSVGAGVAVVVGALVGGKVGVGEAKPEPGVGVPLSTKSLAWSVSKPAG